jgi:hypothetical protein
MHSHFEDEANQSSYRVRNRNVFTGRLALFQKSVNGEAFLKIIPHNVNSAHRESTNLLLSVEYENRSGVVIVNRNREDPTLRRSPGLKGCV